MDLLELENSPKFAELSYNEQVSLRGEWFNQTYGRNRQFLQLPDQEKAQLMEQALFRPPVLEDKRLQQEVGKVGAQALAGNEEALKFMQREVNIGAFENQSIIAKMFDKHLVSGLAEKAQEASGNNPFGHGDIVVSPDQQQVLAYFDTLLSQDQKAAKRSQIVKPLLSIAGAVTDFALMFALTGGSGVGAKAAVASGKVAGGAPKALGKLATHWGQTIWNNASSRAGMRAGLFVGQAGHASLTAGLGLAREYTRSWLNDEDMPVERKAFLEKSGRWFGGYFVGDLVMNIVQSYMWPMMKVVGMSFSGASMAERSYMALAGAEVGEVLESMIRGRAIPKNILERMPKEIQERLVSQVKAANTILSTPKIGQEEITRLVAESFGISISTIDDSGVVKYLAKKHGARKGDRLGYSKPLKDLEEVRAWVSKSVGMDRDAALTAFKLGEEAGSTGFVRARQVVTAELKGYEKFDQLPPEVLAQMAAPVNGKFVPENLEVFTKTIMTQHQVDPRYIAKLEVLPDRPGVPRNYEFIINGQKVHTAKAGLLSPKEETLELKRLIDRFAKRTGEDAFPKWTAPGMEEALTGRFQKLREDFISTYTSSKNREVVSSPAFLNDMAEESLGMSLQRKGTQWVLGEEVFDSLDDAGNSILQRAAAPEHVGRYMHMEYGLNLKVDPETGKVVVKRGADFRESANSLEELLAKNPQYTPKIDARYAPKFSMVTDELEMTYVNKVLVGNEQEIKKFLNSFQYEYTEPEQVLTIAGKKKMTFNNVTGDVEIEIPDVGHRQTFQSLDDARTFLRGWTEAANMEKIALAKGYRMTSRDGKWILYSGDGKRYTVDSLDGVKAKLAEVPTPSYVPELTGVDDELVKSYATKELADIEFFKPESFLAEPKPVKTRGPFRRKKTRTGGEVLEADVVDATDDVQYSFSTLVGQFHLPPRQLFEKIAKDGGSDLPLQWYNNLEDSLQAMRGEAAGWYGAIDRVFRGADGKTIGYNKRLGVRDLLETSDPTKRTKIIAQYGLKDSDLVVEQQVRALFGTDPESGLALTFDLPVDKFLTEYFPRVRIDYTDKAIRMKLAKAKDAQAVLKEIYKGNVPPPVTAFFKKARKEDVLKFAAVKDPLEALHVYVRSGLKDRYVTPVVEKALNALNEKEIGTLAFTQFKRYIADIGNMPGTDGERIMREITPRLLAMFGAPPGLSQDLTKLFMSGGYVSLMGFRPWLPMRNLMQVYTMLAPRVGNEWVSYATRVIANDTDGKLFTRLREAGVLQQNIPLFGAEAFDAEKVLGKLAHKGLQWYKNSDDLERAIAYVAAEGRYQEAVKRFLGGKLGDMKDVKAQKAFAELAGWSTLGKDEKGRMMALLQRGRFDDAGKLYAERITELSMFPYRAGTSPQVFNGVFGKIFGMMGHYPVYYVDNIRRMIQNMTPWEKVIAGGTFVGNSMALYGAFKYIVGIDARNFLPWNPAMFGGGPMFDLTVMGLDLIGGGSQEKKMAQAQLLGLSKNDSGEVVFRPLQSQIAKNFLPFSHQIRSIGRAWEAWDNGDLMQALNHLTSAPTSLDEYLLDM